MGHCARQQDSGGAECTITDLSANAKYYIRTYARYMTDSIRYGNTIEFYTY